MEHTAALDTAPLDYAAVTRAQQKIWASGDFSFIAPMVVPVAEALVSAADPHAGQNVLDVACGSGNVALAAARRYCEVTGLDYVPSLLERGRQRAAAEHLKVRFIEGDAQALPFDDGAFDFVLSTFGVMFAPNQTKAASELVRVCRGGGTIGLANWTPAGAVGDFFRCVTKYAPPPAGLKPPTLWGSERGLRELLGGAVTLQKLEHRTVTEYFLSVEHAIDVFRTYFGPTERAFASLDAAGQRALAEEIGVLFLRDNRATDGTLAVPLEYLEAIVTVRRDAAA